MKENILVIDDDRFVCKGISALLEKYYTVDHALTGKEGIDKFQKTSPSIVFVDYCLPDMDGLEVVGKLNHPGCGMTCDDAGAYAKGQKAVGIIFITSCGDMELVVKALRAGVFDYVEKPIEPEILMASLRRLETFRMLEQQRYRAELEKEMLVFSLSHELRNFLAIISGNVQLLESGTVSQPERKKAFEAIKTTLKDSVVIMDKLRDYVKLKSAEGISQSLDVNSLVTNAVSSLRYIFEGTDSRAVKIDTHLGDCKKIKVDPTEVHGALVNILINAGYALKGEGDIAISTSMEKDFVVTKISDTGPGIPEEIREKLCRPFTNTWGTGIGLFWSSFIVSRWGGTMGIEGAPGRGTTVLIRFPCER